MILKKGKEKSFACENSIVKTSAEHAEDPWSLAEVGDKKVSKQDLKQVCSKHPMFYLVSTHTTHSLNEDKKSTWEGQLLQSRDAHQTTQAHHL